MIEALLNIFLLIVSSIAIFVVVEMGDTIFYQIKVERDYKRRKKDEADD